MTLHIDTKDFDRDLLNGLKRLTEFSNRQKKELQHNPPDFQKIKREIVELLPEYKNLTSDQLVKEAIEIAKAVHKLDNFRLLMQIYDYEESISQRETQDTDFVKDFDKHREGMLSFLPKVADEIESAIQRAEDFQQRVVLSPMWNQELDVEHIKSFHVSLGSVNTMTSFTVFTDTSGKIEHVDDVLEGGDEDCFDNPVQQLDYFNLIKEIRKPGSSSTGKMLTLYTARLVKDRAQYLHAHSLPVNLFLANREDHVEGIAQDFGGRDVWLVKVSDRYLVQTLDGSVKYYQVVKEAPLKQAPILVSPGTVKAAGRSNRVVDYHDRYKCSV